MKPEKIYDCLDGEWVIAAGLTGVVAYRCYHGASDFGNFRTYGDYGRVIIEPCTEGVMLYLAQNANTLCGSIEEAQRAEDAWARTHDLIGPSTKDRRSWGE